MGKKILNSKGLYVVISVIIAITMWVYVSSLDGNEYTQTYHNIPVTFAGVETLERRGLMIVSETPTASVEIKASPRVLATLNKDNIKLTVNVAQLEEAAQYTLAYTASLPSTVSEGQAEFVSGGSGNVSFTVARYSTRHVEIRGEFIGTVAEGYLAGTAEDFIFAPEKLTISGQSDEVNRVAYVKVVVDGKDLTETVSGEFAYQLIGADGSVLEDLNVECDSERIYLSYPIRATAEIPLVVKLIPGGGLSEDNMTYTLSASSITVAGSKSAVTALQKEGAITVATIDLATIRNAGVLTYAIPLTDELENISGFNDVTVTITPDPDVQTITLNATDIDFINLPEGWRALAITKMLAVTVRGSADLVAAVTEENLRVVVDLANVNMTAGQATLPATVYLDSVGTVNEIGIVGTDYKVVVSLRTM